MADYKILTIPFGRDAVPDMVNDIPSDPIVAEPQRASFKQGFPSITTIPLVAGGIPPEGQDFNGILRDITEHIVHQNKGGMYKFEPEVVADGGYPEGAVLAANDGLSLWVSLVDANVEDFNAGTPTQWARIAFSGLDALLNGKLDKSAVVQTTGVSTTNVMSQKAVTDALAGVDKFNAAPVTVASASTVDLTALAPNTSQITITGDVPINGFTVAAGRAFVVKFTGACALVNSGSLVTGTGASITTQAGDTCIIRATAADVVEVLCYVENASARSSLSGAGYHILPSGLIWQWGTRTSVPGSNVTITLPIAFPNAAFVVVLGSRNAGAGVVASYSSLTTTTFDVRAGAVTDLSWLAIGY